MCKIGIDAGGSLIKLAYFENRRLHVKTYPYDEKEKLVEWLQFIAPNASIYGTGGKWNELKKSVKRASQSIDEFTALIRGTNYLLNEEHHTLDKYILVSIGTGTSFFYVENNTFERLLGSGIGGGTWVGLGSLLANTSNFDQLVQLSELGNRANSDLLVKDIYQNSNAPLAAELTAANFGKAHLHMIHTDGDHIQALNQLIGEVILSLAYSFATNKGVRDIVFVGSTLLSNRPLKEVLSSFQQMLDYKPIFVDKGAYAGAIGAMLD